MSLEQYNEVLGWILFLNAFPPLIGAVICLLWMQIVERRISRIIFTTAFAALVLIVMLRFTLSYRLDNYLMRAILSMLALVNGMIHNVVFAWAYTVERRERDKRTTAERRLLESNPFLYAQTLIEKMHPKDAETLSAEIKNYRGESVTN